MDISRAPNKRLRWFYRAPITFYRLGLGRLMGGRVLMLTHKGRKSGLDRYVVLEVVDRTSEGWYVAAAYGSNADWFRNIKADPNVTVNYKGTRRAATATIVNETEGAEVLRRYGQAHPRAARTLGRLMGVPMEGDMSEASRTIPIVKLS
jgi:deazaflavin-dependent oxidoreductase (nitroreductase family)